MQDRTIPGDRVALTASRPSARPYEREDLSLARAIDGGRRAGVGRYVREVVERAWTTRFGIVVSLVLAGMSAIDDGCRLRSLKACDGRSYSGFSEAAARTTGEEYLELRRRVWLSHHDPNGLFVAEADDGAPLFAAWLSPVTAKADGAGTTEEVWIEAVYTFPKARGQGVMRAGVSELVEIARARGATRVSAVINNRNTASLRGFAAVGFLPREAHAEVWRGWRRRFEARPLDAALLEDWRAAVSRPQA